MKTTREAERGPGSGEASAPADVASVPSMTDLGASGKARAESLPADDGVPSEEPTSGEHVERDIDELRRFRVRTVPPEMRRRWLLAEVPVVSTLELQDTAPPNQSDMVAPPAPISTRASLSAVTRKIPRVPRRSARSNVAFVAAAAVAIIGAGSAAFVLSGSKARVKTETTESRPATPIAQTEPARAPAAPELAFGGTRPNGGALVPTIIAPVNTSRAPAGSSITVVPPPASVPARTTVHHAQPSTLGGKPAASSKSAAEKSKLDTDIKAPLFEND